MPQMSDSSQVDTKVKTNCEDKYTGLTSSRRDDKIEIMYDYCIYQGDSKDANAIYANVSVWGTPFNKIGL